MKKMKSSLLVVCIAGNLACGSSNLITAQEITPPDAPSRIADPASNLKVSQAATSGSVAQPRGSISFGRQVTAHQLVAGSLARKHLADDRSAVLSKSGAIGQSGRIASSAASSPRSGSLEFSLKVSKAGPQGQIDQAPSRSARSTSLAGSAENASINLEVFSQSRLVD